jgi:hypothetical protein
VLVRQPVFNITSSGCSTRKITGGGANLYRSPRRHRPGPTCTSDAVVSIDALDVAADPTTAARQRFAAASYPGPGSLQDNAAGTLALDLRDLRLTRR